MHGDRETRAFAALPSMESATAARLSHLVLMQAAPALMEQDIRAFGLAITEIQALVGRHFAPAQNGSPWSDPKVGEIALWKPTVRRELARAPGVRLALRFRPQPERR